MVVIAWTARGRRGFAQWPKMLNGGSMPRVSVRIPRSLLVYHPHLRERETLELAEGETLRDLVRRLGLDQLEFGIAVVNGERELMSYRPRDGEEIELLPIIHGGAPGGR
jgi:sulfur carrier protein ThiS